MKIYNKNLGNSMHAELVDILMEIRKNKSFDSKKYIQTKAELINQYCKISGIRGCVVGISGGIDSAVVLGILNKASQLKNSPIEKVAPILLPIISSIGATEQAEATVKGLELCKRFNYTPRVVDLSTTVQEIHKEVDSSLNIEGDGWAVGQLCSYIRTPVLYYSAAILSKEGFPGVVCGTTNRDEGAYLGFIGKASDAMVDLQIISDIHKSEVYQVAEELNIPQSIITAIPTGNTFDARTDEIIFGTTYDFVELYLNYLTTPFVQEKVKNSISLEAYKEFGWCAQNLEELHRYNAHKYLGKSPAVHMDLWNSSVPGGWDNYYGNLQNFLKDISTDE